MNDLLSIEKRLAGVEGSLRRWKIGFAALALLVVGVAADDAVKDATFGTVKASKFEVVAPSGQVVAQLNSSKDDNGEEQGFLLVIGDHKKKATFVMAGDGELSVKNESK